MRLDQYPIDPLFRVEVVSATPNPQRAIWVALHTDYSERYVWEEIEEGRLPSEERAGEIAVKSLLSGGRFHGGPLEHPQIIFNVGYFPHSVVQQGRTHRICSWDVQSMRYSGSRIEDFVSANKEVCPQDLADDHEFFRGLERLFYLRQPGFYDARSGGRYEYTAESRRRDLIHVYDCAIAYVRARNTGQSEEQARGLLGFDYRQHFVLSLNMRSLMHLLDCRYKPDAQLEVRQFCSLILPHFREWAPQVFEWYERERLGKGRLGP